VKNGFIKAFAKRLKSPDAQTILDDFVKSFDRHPIVQKGTRATFTWCMGGFLAVEVNGECVAMTHNPQLCRAIFETYLGYSNVSWGTKRSFVRGWESFMTFSRQQHPCLSSPLAQS